MGARSLPRQAYRPSTTTRSPKHPVNSALAREMVDGHRTRHVPAVLRSSTPASWQQADIGREQASDLTFHPLCGLQSQSILAGCRSASCRGTGPSRLALCSAGFFSVANGTDRLLPHSSSESDSLAAYRHPTPLLSRIFSTIPQAGNAPCCYSKSG
jgi:hypothetical protein